MRSLSLQVKTPLMLSLDLNVSFVHVGRCLPDYDYRREVLFTPSEVSMSSYRVDGSYLSSERVLVRPAGHWGPLRSLPPELKGASWEVRGCGELCWERERSGRGCCCSSGDDPRVGYCRWRPEAHLGSWGLSSRIHMGTGISCTLRGEHTHTKQYIRSPQKHSQGKY